MKYNENKYADQVMKLLSKENIEDTIIDCASWDQSCRVSKGGTYDLLVELDGENHVTQFI